MMFGMWSLDPRTKSDVTSKWLFKIKHGVDGSAEKFKVKCIA